VPDASGSYINGTWSQLASMSSGYGPLYYASAVLANGRVVVNGGEYNLSGAAVLTNLGATALDWTASITADWLSLSATNGTLAVGASTNVTVFIIQNASSLPVSTNSDTIAFTNLSNGMGDTNWPISLAITLTPFQSWQVLYFGSTNAPTADAYADPDHDGMSNTNEFLAGTDPLDSSSVLAVTNIVRRGNDLQIYWTMGSGRTNVLQRADRLRGTNGFVDICTVLTVGSFTNYLDVGAGTNAPGRYYRVLVKP